MGVCSLFVLKSISRFFKENWWMGRPPLLMRSDRRGAPPRDSLWETGSGQSFVRFLFPMWKGEAFGPDWGSAGARSRSPPHRRAGWGPAHPHARDVATFIIEGSAEGIRMSKGESSRIAAIEAGFDVLPMILGRHLPLNAAVANEAARIEGSAHTLRKLPSLFGLATAKR